jgi:hypothetical protein
MARDGKKDTAEMRERVCFPGILQGEGHKASCTVWMTRHNPRGQPAFYDEYFAEDIPTGLPDGSYTISINGQIIAVRIQDGKCLAADPR